ncbi:hypothetical protein CHLNCDRAFT_55913, partial [Chlorella variabilis]
YGDWLRSGWRNVMDAVLRLHRLDLLPAAVIAGDGEDPEEARLRLPRPASISKSRGSSGSLFSRAFTSLISIEGSDGASAEQACRRRQLPPPRSASRCPRPAGAGASWRRAIAAREAELTGRALASVEACHVEEIFADSKFL